jgi:hypothetical protein
MLKPSHIRIKEQKAKQGYASRADAGQASDLTFQTTCDKQLLSIFGV